MNGLPSFDLTILVIYLAAMVAMGLWIGRRSSTPDRFMKAGGAIPGWAVGLSIFGTYVSSISFLALPGKAYAADWNAFAFSLGIPLAAWAAVKWYVPFYRRSGEVSAYEHLEHRFGLWARTYAVGCYLLTQLGRMATILYLLAIALRPLTGWSLPTLILLTGLTVIVYTLIGGMEAVIWTDVVQSVVLVGGALACVFVLLAGMPDGPTQAFAIAAGAGKLSLGSLSLDVSRATFWVVLLNGIFINLQNFGIDQNYVQRFGTAAGDREAAKSVWLGGLLYLPVSALFLLIGSLLFAYYRAHPELSLTGIGGDDVFPHFIATALPPGVGGLVLAAIFAAAQSTLSSSVNCSATVTLCDIYRRLIRPRASERESMVVLRLATIAYGLAGTATALAMIGVTSALDAWWAVSSICSGGMLGLFLLGIVSRARNAAAATGTVVGFLAICWMTISVKWPEQLGRLTSPFHSFMITVIGTLIILGIGLLLDRVRVGRNRDLPLPRGTRP
jgi:SSS family solute:Na+ symporter